MLTDKQQKAKDILSENGLNYEVYPNRNEYTYLVIYTTKTSGGTHQNWTYYYTKRDVIKFIEKAIGLRTLGIDKIYNLDSGFPIELNLSNIELNEYDPENWR